MDARKRMALVLSALLFGMGGSTAFAEAQYTARDKNGQIVKQGTTTENEEFSAFDGLEYEFNGEHQVSDWQNTAYVFGDRTKIHINGDVINHKQGTSIEVTDQASAVINGNLYGDVRNFSAALKIFGDIEAEPNGGMGAVFATGENGNRIKYRTQTTITGNVQSTGIGVSASPGGHINITGNVKAGTNGVEVGDISEPEGVDSAAVEVQGNITAQENGIVVYQKNPDALDGLYNIWNDTFCVKVRGNVRGEVNGIDTYGDVSIEGNVIGGWCAVALNGKADVQIVGNVTATKKEIDYSDVDYYNEYGEWRMYCGDAIKSFWNDGQPKDRKIKVIGDVTATGDRILMECGKAIVEGNVRSQYGNCVNVLDGLPVSIDIKGNVEGKVRWSAISIMPNAEDQVIVRGKIEARGKQSAVDIYDVAFDYDPAETLCNLPQIMVKEITVESGDYFTATVHHLGVEEWLEDAKALAEATAKAAWYIVDVNQPTNGEIEVKGTSVKEGLLVAHEGDKLTVTGAPKKGYRLTGIDAGSKALVTENEDGTYTVTVERGGDVTISALFEAMPEMPETGDQAQIERTVFFMAASAAMLAFLRKTKRE